MAITTRDQLINSLANNSSRLVIDKASIPNTAAGQFHSLWRANGQPGQGAIPTAVAACTNALTGSFQFTQQVAPSTSYIAYLEAVCSTSSTTLELHDRLAHMGGLVGNVSTAQNVLLDLNSLLGANNMDARVGDSNYSDVQWWVEWYGDTGSTAATLTVNVTYDDGSTGNLTGVSLAATRRASFLQPLNGLIPAAQSGRYIRGVNTIQLSVSTGTAGNIGVTATRPRASLGCSLANIKWAADWANLPISEIPNQSCLFVLMLASTSNTGTVRGGGKIAHG